MSFFRRFRRRAAAGVSVYIDGNLYSRQGSEISVFVLDTGDLQIAELDHIAPNGVGIRSIALALALAEGLVGFCVASNEKAAMN